MANDKAPEGFNMEMLQDVNALSPPRDEAREKIAESIGQLLAKKRQRDRYAKLRKLYHEYFEVLVKETDILLTEFKDDPEWLKEINETRTAIAKLRVEMHELYYGTPLELKEWSAPKNSAASSTRQSPTRSKGKGKKA